MQVFAILLYVLLSAGGLILFKLGAGGLQLSLGAGALSLRVGWLPMLGILCYGGSFLLYLSLVSRYHLSYIFPLANGSIYLCIFLASWLIFREPLALPQILGGALVLAGILLINARAG